MSGSRKASVLLWSTGGILHEQSGWQLWLFKNSKKVETYPDFSRWETLRREVMKGETYQTKTEFRGVIIEEQVFEKVEDGMGDDKIS